MYYINRKILEELRAENLIKTATESKESLESEFSLFIYEILQNGDCSFRPKSFTRFSLDSEIMTSKFFVERKIIKPFEDMMTLAFVLACLDGGDLCRDFLKKQNNMMLNENEMTLEKVYSTSKTETLNLEDVDYSISQITSQVNVYNFLIGMSERNQLLLMKKVAKFGKDSIKTYQGKKVIFIVGDEKISVYFPKSRDAINGPEVLTYPRLMNRLSKTWGQHAAKSGKVSMFGPLALSVGFQSLWSEEFSLDLIETMKNTKLEKLCRFYSENSENKYAPVMCGLPKVRPLEEMKLNNLDLYFFLVYGFITDLVNLYNRGLEVEEMDKSSQFFMDFYSKSTMIKKFNYDSNDFDKFCFCCARHCIPNIKRRSFPDAKSFSLMNKLLKNYNRLMLKEKIKDQTDLSNQVINLMLQKVENSKRSENSSILE